MRHLLVVDDDPSICALMRLALETYGTYRVTAATNTGEAQAAIARDRPAAAIIDVLLPGVGGLEFAAWVLSKDIPVLLMSGHPSAEARLDQAGCPYLAKPFRIEALHAEIRALLDDEKDRVAVLKLRMRDALAAAAD